MNDKPEIEKQAGGDASIVANTITGEVTLTFHDDNGTGTSYTFCYHTSMELGKALYITGQIVKERKEGLKDDNQGSSSCH